MLLLNPILVWGYTFYIYSIEYFSVLNLKSDDFFSNNVRIHIVRNFAFQIFS